VKRKREIKTGEQFLLGIIGLKKQGSSLNQSRIIHMKIPGKIMSQQAPQQPLIGENMMAILTQSAIKRYNHRLAQKKN
jgi:hypothetical protein